MATADHKTWRGLLDGEDAIRLLDIAQQIADCESAESLAEAIVHHVARLMPCQACGWFELDMESGYSYGTMNLPVDPAAMAREIQLVLHGHPVLQKFMQNGGGWACAISDLMARRAFLQSDLYLRFLHKHGFEDQLVLADICELNRLLALSVYRGGWGFTAREKAMLNALRPVLFQTYRHLWQLAGLCLASEGVCLNEQMRPALIHALAAIGMTPREAEVAAWIAEGACNHRIAEALGICCGTVRKHVDRVFLKLGVHNRAAATRAALGLLNRSGAADNRPKIAAPSP